MEASRRPTLPARVTVGLDVSPRALIRLLIVIISVLVVVDVALQTYHYRVHEVPWLIKDLFDLDEEQNIPTWYSSAALLVACWLLMGIATAKKRLGDPDRRFWYVLTGGFLFLSLDEAAALHEGINTLTNSDNNKNPFSWAIIGAIIVTLLAVFFMKFVQRLPAWFRVRCLIAGAIYVSGVVGMELVVHQYLETHDIDTLGYNLISAAEETLEMVGVVAFIHALLAYIGIELGGGTVATSPPAPAPEIAATP